MIPLLIILLAPPATPQTQRAEVKFDLLYTGRLLGYFRNPDKIALSGEGKMNEPGCPDIETSGSAAARELLKQMKVMQDRPLLVGMGDNSAPELFSRMFDVAGKFESKDGRYWSRKQERWVPVEESAPEDEEDELSGRSEVVMDNVGCFLRQLQYKALVPGKHDFYFGPERLRQYARFLVKTDSNKDARLPLRLAKDPQAPKAPVLNCTDCAQVHMLAANLAIAASRPDSHPPVPDYLNHKLKFDADGGQVAVELPSVVFPWMRKFRVSGAYRLSRPGKDGRPVVADEFGPKANVRKAEGNTLTVDEGTGDLSTVTVDARVVGAKLCEAGSGGPDDIDPLGGRCVTLDLAPLTSMVGGGPSTSLTLELPKNNGVFRTLNAGTNYAVCLEKAKSTTPAKNSYYCARFFVYHPYFQYPLRAVTNLGPGTVDGDLYADTPRPYVVIKERNLVIFGVVDADMKESIGSANYTWVQPPERRPARTSRVEATVAFADPASSLDQLLQRCDLDENCRGARKILLAQMPEPEAKLLGIKMRNRFDLIIAQTDSRQASGDETRSVTLRDASGTPSFVVVPRQMYEPSKPGQIEITLQKVAVERKEKAGAFVWSQTHELIQGSVRLETATNELQTYFDNYILARRWDKWDDDPALRAPGGWSLASRVQRVVLDAMQRRFHADVALLQRRDLFQPAFELRFGANVKELQPWLDRVIWKGDFAIHYAVTGAALKAAMQKSKDLARMDGDPLNYDLEKGRDLLAVGIVEDRVRKLWLIRGEPVEDGRMYSIVSSDYLAFGDTGYADLRRPAAGLPPRVSELQDVFPLSALVCHTFAAMPAYKNINCSDAGFPAQTYLDWTSMKPMGSTTVMTPLRRVRYWLMASLREGKHGPLARTSTPAIEKSAQNAPNWSVALEKAELSYNLYGHNQGSEDSLAQRFAGIPISQVQAPNSSALSLAYRLRTVYAARHVDWFALSESAYGRVFTRQTASNGGGFLKDQKANQAAVEGGMTPRLWPMFKQVPDLKGLLAVRYQTQFAEPFTAFRFKDGIIRQSVERTNSLFVKMGLRYQNRRSWVEGGFQVGSVRNLPTSYILNVASAERCSAVNVGRGNTLGDCLIRLELKDVLNRSKVVQPVYRQSLRQDGFFLNYRVMVPLPFGNDRYYVQENRGDLFLNHSGDTPIDTRLFDTWSHSLMLPLWANFSIVPKVDFWFYRNKVTGSWFASRQTSVALQYRFEWRQGLPWRKVLQYPWPPPR